MYQSLPVQFERAQFKGARALQKQLLVNLVQPMLEAWKGRQGSIAHFGMNRKSISEARTWWKRLKRAGKKNERYCGC